MRRQPAVDPNIRSGPQARLEVHIRQEEFVLLIEDARALRSPGRRKSRHLRVRRSDDWQQAVGDSRVYRQWRRGNHDPFRVHYITLLKNKNETSRIEMRDPQPLLASPQWMENSTRR